MLHDVDFLGEQVCSQTGTEDVWSSDTCFRVEQLEPESEEDASDDAIVLTLIDVFLYHSSGMKPMRTLPGCSARFGRSKPGEEEAPRATASTAGR